MHNTNVVVRNIEHSGYYKCYHRYFKAELKERSRDRCRQCHTAVYLRQVRVILDRC